MSIEEVPKSYIYKCDVPGCRARHTQANATGHYTNSTPPYWLSVDWAGWIDGMNGLKSNFTKFLLCTEHAEEFKALWAKHFSGATP